MLLLLNVQSIQNESFVTKNGLKPLVAKKKWHLISPFPKKLLGKYNI